MARRSPSRRGRTPSFQDQFAVMNTFMRALKEGHLPEQPLLLYGPERYVWRKAVDRIRSLLDRPLRRVDVSDVGPEEAVRHLAQKDLFGGPSALLWMDHVEVWDHTVWNVVLEQIGNHRVVFTTLKETPPVQDDRVQAIPFPSLARNRTLFEQWVRAELKRRRLRLSREAGRFLLEHLPDSLETVSRLLDQLELYRGDEDTMLHLEEITRFLQMTGSQVYTLVDGWLGGHSGPLWTQWNAHTLDLPMLTRFLPHALWDMIRAQAKDTTFSLRYSWKRKVYTRIATFHPPSDLWWALAESARRTLRERTSGVLENHLSDTYWLARLSRTSFQRT